MKKILNKSQKKSQQKVMNKNWGIDREEEEKNCVSNTPHKLKKKWYCSKTKLKKIHTESKSQEKRSWKKIVEGFSSEKLHRDYFWLVVVKCMWKKRVKNLMKNLKNNSSRLCDSIRKKEVLMVYESLLTSSKKKKRN